LASARNVVMTKRIHLISGPRNISTALMYSFGNRADCAIVDEPMYGVYLSTHDVQHPGREETLASLSQDMKSVKENVIFGDYQEDLLFLKNMAHHFIGVEHDFIYNLHNLFLIRKPKQLIASFAQVIPNPTMQDIGLEKEYALFADLLQNGKHKPLVLDSGLLLDKPESIIKSLCSNLKIPFSDSMLQWKAGPRKEDGIWAKYWYANVHKSTGFLKQKTSERKLPEHLHELHARAKHYYDLLYKHAIRN